MDRILIVLKKENGPRASSAPALGLNTIIFKHVYYYSPSLKKWGYTGFTMSFRRSVLPLFSYSVIPSKFHFHSISWEPVNRIWPNFVCTLTLTRSSLGLLTVIFCKILTELPPLIDVGVARIGKVSGVVFLQFDHRSISLLTECRMYILPTTGFEGKPFISETTLCCVYHSRHIGCCFPLGQYSKQYVSALVRLTYRLSVCLF